MEYVYVLQIDWAYHGDMDINIKIFSSIDKARKALNEYIEQDKEDFISSLYNMVDNSDLEKDWYEVYEDDDYIANHSFACIQKLPIL